MYIRMYVHAQMHVRTLMYATSDICSYVYVGWKAAYSLCMFSWTSLGGSHSNQGVQC